MEYSTGGRVPHQASNPLSIRSTGKPTVSPVHWQSAFWGVALVALNTMLQDSGRVCYLSAKYRFMLRSSPLICLADSISIVTEFVILLRHQTSPLKAIHIIAARRSGFKRAENEESNRNASWYLLWIIRILAFIQAIKVFGLQGVPWTQAFTAMFLASYILVEALNQLSKPVNPNQPIFSLYEMDCFKTYERCFQRLATFYPVFLWTLTLRQLFPTIASVMSHPLMRPGNFRLYPFQVYFGNVALTCLCNFGFVLMFSLLFLKFHGISTLFQPIPAIEMVFTATIATGGCVLLPFWAQVALGLKTGPETSDSHTKKEFYTNNDLPPCMSINNALSFQLSMSFLIVSAVAIAFYGPFRVLSSARVIAHIPQSYQKHLEKRRWSSAYFFFMNFASALVYYSRIYTGKGTVKPSWTENLG